MGYPLTIALRYLASKKRSMISISTALAIGGVVLGVAALTIVMSVTGGFQEQFREKVESSVDAGACRSRTLAPRRN